MRPACLRGPQSRDATSKDCEVGEFLCVLKLKLTWAQLQSDRPADIQLECGSNGDDSPKKKQQGRRMKMVR